MRRIFRVLSLSGLLALGGQVSALQDGNITRNALEVFSLSSLENGRGQLTASTAYQTALEFPFDVQSVAVTISKQTALIPTVGGPAAPRVVYLDVEQADGNATLNVVLSGNRLVQFDVALTSRRDGVTRYRVVNPDDAASALQSSNAATPPVISPARTGVAVPRSTLGSVSGQVLPDQTLQAGGVSAKFSAALQPGKAVITYALTYSGTDTVFVRPQNLSLLDGSGAAVAMTNDVLPESSLLLARLPLTGRFTVALPAGARELMVNWAFQPLLDQTPLVIRGPLSLSQQGR